MRLPELFVLALVPTALHAAPTPLSLRIEALIAKTPVATAAFWGIEARDLDTGRTLVRLNEQRFFVPASNTKLFTTALALTRLGAAYQVETTVTAAALPDPDGHIAGSLVLLGAGDPNLSGRPIPYDVKAPKLDPLTAMRDLATKLFAQGLRFVDGDVIGDDTRFLYEPYSPGWGVDDPAYSDGAPVSALAVNDNCISVFIQPGGLTFTPPLAVFTVENRIVAGPKREIHIDRQPGSNTLRIWGTQPGTDQGETDLLGVDDPARYAALALISALRDQGISVTGNAVARHRYAGDLPFLQTGVTLASHPSPPLLENLRVTDKVSQNLHAEMLLRLVGQGSRKQGLEEMDDFLAHAGIAKRQYSLHDGSGLSRLNVVTPHAVVQLLTFMATGPSAADFASLLPIAGVDGSLRLRFSDSRAKGIVFAKTGSLSHVSALSGYALRADGHRIAFSVLVNNYNAPTSQIRDVIDRICGLLVE